MEDNITPLPSQDEAIDREGMPYTLFMTLRTRLSLTDGETTEMPDFSEIVPLFKRYVTRGLFDQGYLAENKPELVDWARIYHLAYAPTAMVIAQDYFRIENETTNAPAAAVVTQDIERLASMMGLVKHDPKSKIEPDGQTHDNKIVPIAQQTGKIP